MGARRRVRALSRGFTLVAAVVVLALGIAQAPHTVHHLFDAGGRDGGGDPFQECAFASAADRTQAASTPAAVAAAIAEVHPGSAPTPTLALLARTLTASPARAPPTSAA